MLCLSSSSREHLAASAGLFLAPAYTNTSQTLCESWQAEFTQCTLCSHEHLTATALLFLSFTSAQALPIKSLMTRFQTSASLFLTQQTRTQTSQNQYIQMHITDQALTPRLDHTLSSTQRASKMRQAKPTNTMIHMHVLIHSIT